MRVDGRCLWKDDGRLREDGGCFPVDGEYFRDDGCHVREHGSHLLNFGLHIRDDDRHIRDYYHHVREGCLQCLDDGDEICGGLGSKEGGKLIILANMRRKMYRPLRPAEALFLEKSARFKIDRAAA